MDGEKTYRALRRSYGVTYKNMLNGKKLLKEKNKPKKKSISKLKKELDKVFSEFIRRKYSDHYGYVNCYTCGLKKHWKEIQNGHFVSRSCLATRYSEDNCRPQCVGCNVFGGGKIALFALKLDSEKRNTVTRLYRESQTIIKNYPYEEQIEKYKKLLNE